MTNISRAGRTCSWVADEPDVAVGEALEAELIGPTEAGAPVADAGRTEGGFELRVAGELEGFAGDDDVGPVRQRATEAIEGLAAHEDELAGGEFLEPLEIFGQVPGDLVVAPDDAIERHGGDGDQGRVRVEG
jgi:hypothetical protein